ncbi:metallophosphoesterase [Eubacteriales bacterium OttesenSCG-928-K08]|nr:metallophosphoesterase [Eubacteriales bacterium OttesenSCG-928-K08]
MRVFSIGDLHLPGAGDKPMDRFGQNWERHSDQIAANWRENVSPEDIVLLPGDFSWAMHLKDTEQDFAYLEELPGTKVMIRGNHDYWWNSLSKVRAMLPGSVHVIQNDHFSLNNVHVCGTRGWICPGASAFGEDDQKLYDREFARLALSIKGLPEGGLRLAMLHYPPFNDKWAASGFSEQFEKAKIDIVLYGHLHGRSCRGAFEGIRNGVEYHLVSADHLGFQPKLIREFSNK